MMNTPRAQAVVPTGSGGRALIRPRYPLIHDSKRMCKEVTGLRDGSAPFWNLN